MAGKRSPIRRCLELTLVVTAWAAAAAQSGEADHAAQGREILEDAQRFVAGCENRYPGAPGNQRMSDKIESIFRESSGPSGITRYESAVFLPGEAEITVAGRTIELHPLLPNLVDPCCLDEKEFTGPLYYVGKGRLVDLDGRSLEDSLCLFEFNCGYNYLDAVPRGARACIFIEPDEYWPTLAYEKVLGLPMDVPRFQVSRADGRFLKQHASGPEGAPFEAKIEPNRWERREFKNHWALVEGSDPEAKEELVILHTHLDSLHYCPGLASGGHEALNLKLLMDLYKTYRKRPPGRSLLFQVHNMAHQFHTGASEAVYHLFGPEKDIFNVDRSRSSEERIAWRRKMENEYLLEQYPRLRRDRICPATLEDFRNRRDKPAGFIFPLAEPIVHAIQVARHRLSEERIRLFRQEKLTPERKEKIEEERRRLGDLVSLLNRFGQTAVYAHALIRGSDITEMEAWLTKLKEGGASSAPSPARRVWRLLGEEIQGLIEKLLAGEAVPADASRRILVGVNRLVRNPKLADGVAWNDVKLGGGGKALQDRGKTGTLAGEELMELNRRLLDAAFPSHLTPMKKREADAELRELTPAQRATFEQYRRQVMEEARVARERAELHLGRLREVREARQALKPYHPLVAFELSATYGNRWLNVTKGGASGKDFDDGSSHVSRRKNYGRLFGNRLTTLAEPIERRTGVRWASGRGEGFLYKDKPPLASLQYMMQRVPAYAFLTPYGGNGNLLGSGDRLEALDPEIVSRKRAFMERMIREILRDEKTGTLARRADDGGLESVIPWRLAGSVHLETRVNDGSSTGRPKTVLTDALAVMPLERSTIEFSREMAAASAIKGGVLGHRVSVSDPSGDAFFYNGARGATYRLEVFHVDDAGEIDYARDKGRLLQKYTVDWQPSVDFKDHFLLAAVRCRKADLYDLFHPQSLEGVGKPMFERAGGGQVQRFSHMGMEELQLGFGPVFFRDDIRAKLLFSGNVNLLNNTPKEFKGMGYLAEELDGASVPLLAARDALNINESRIRLLKRNAVTNNLMDAFQEKAKKWFPAERDTRRAALRELRTKRDHCETFRQATRSYGAAFGAYPIVNNTIADMMKAVVFYLAVLIPFAFFLQRLLFSFVRIEVQIASFVTLFLVTYGVFHFVHPAFRIARNPQIVLIAFTMLTLAIFVAMALKGKFDYHMEDFKERFQSEEDVGVVKLAGTAMMVGVTNMKRRRLRTTLTCFTIVLITFTMLSFTSVSQSVSPTRIKKAEEAPYNGIYYARQSWKELDRRSVSILTEVLGQGCDTLQRGFAAYQDAEKSAALLTEESDRAVPLRGILALQKKEDGWLSAMPVVAGRFFSSDEAMEVLVTDAFARDTLGFTESGDQMKIPPNTWLTVNGVRLRLVGLVSSDRMENMRDLRGVSIVPQGLSGKTSFTMEQESVLEEEEVPEGTFQNVNPRFYVIVPFGIRNMLGVPVVSVSIRLPSAQEVWDRTLEFAHYSDNKVYLGARDRFLLNSEKEEHEEGVYEQPGRYYLGTGFETTFGGLGSLIIPLLVSATIVLNTMLGAVYERRREIDIFNAIGLNPLHIALFFVAEAVVYGILGGVGGYLIGQVLAQAIVYFNWLPEINLNYSSITVVYVILFTMLIVILSTIYPALVAMRTASSSSGRRRIEKMGENLLRVQFPYSFTREMAIAVNSYLKDYFDKHADSSVGDFVAELLACTHEGGDEDLKMTLRYDVALAPYDLGVTQIVTIETKPNTRVGAFMVEAESERRSGQEANWMATNQVFLNGIRKYLLHWRVLSREGQEAHMDHGMELFGLGATGDAAEDASASAATSTEGEA